MEFFPKHVTCFLTLIIQHSLIFLKVTPSSSWSWNDLSYMGNLELRNGVSLHMGTKAPFTLPVELFTTGLGPWILPPLHWLDCPAATFGPRGPRGRGGIKWGGSVVGLAKFLCCGTWVLFSLLVPAEKPRGREMKVQKSEGIICVRWGRGRVAWPPFRRVGEGILECRI